MFSFLYPAGADLDHTEAGWQSGLRPGQPFQQFLVQGKESLTPGE